MANPIFAKTPESYIAALMKVALNAAPGNTYLNQFKTFVTDNGGGTVGLQKLGSALSNYASTDNAAYAASIVSNLGITGASVTEATTNVKALLDTYGADRGKALMQLVDIMINLQSDATWGATANTFVNSVNTGLVYSLNTENTTTDLAVLTAVVNNQTFTLTYNTDKATANIFEAGLVYTPGGNDRINALQDEDVLTGTGTNPTLNATLGNANDNGGRTVAPVLKGVETINVSFTGTSTAGANQSVNNLDLQDATGVATVNITRINDGGGANAVTIDNMAQATNTLGIKGVAVPATVNFDYQNGVLAGSADTGTVNLGGVQLTQLNIHNAAGVIAGVQNTQGFENLTINSNDNQNTVLRLNATQLNKLTIAGSKDLVLANTTAGAERVTVNAAAINNDGNGNFVLDSINASALEASLTIDLSGHTVAQQDPANSGRTAYLSVVGTKNNDTFIINAATADSALTVDGGDGVDTLKLYANLTDVAATTPKSSIVKVENLEVRSQAGAIAVDTDLLADLAKIDVRNENLANTATAFSLNNLTAASAGAINVHHATTLNNGLADTVINAELKTATGTSDTVVVNLVTDLNTETRFNMTLNAHGEVPATIPTGSTANSYVVENVTLNDTDNESNSILVNSVSPANGAQTQNVRGTITLTGGQAGQFANLDAVTGGVYQMDVAGTTNDRSTQLAAASRDAAVNGGKVTANASYRTTDAGVAGDIRLQAQVFDASSYQGDVIARFDERLRADNLSSMAITTNTGNDTLVFDAQNSTTAGYTSGDTVKAGTGLDTLAIDGNNAARIVISDSEWDNTSGIDVLRLAGNAGVANVVAGNYVASAGGSYLIVLDNEFVKQTDSGNNLVIVNNDGDLTRNSETDLVLDARVLAQNTNIQFVGANGDGVLLVASNRIQLSNASANSLNILDGGDNNVNETTVAYNNTATASAGGTFFLSNNVTAGNNNVLEIFNESQVTISDLSNTKNFSRIEATNTDTLARTLNLTLNDAVVDQLVDSNHAAVANNANREWLQVVANDHGTLAGATMGLNVNATVSNKFGLTLALGEGTDTLNITTDPTVTPAVAAAAVQLVIHGTWAANTYGAAATDLLGRTLGAAARTQTDLQATDTFAWNTATVRDVFTYGNVVLTANILGNGAINVYAQSDISFATGANLANVQSISFGNDNVSGIHTITLAAGQTLDMTKVSLTSLGADQLIINLNGGAVTNYTANAQLKFDVSGGGTVTNTANTNVVLNTLPQATATTTVTLSEALAATTAYGPGVAATGLKADIEGLTTTQLAKLVSNNITTVRVTDNTDLSLTTDQLTSLGNSMVLQGTTGGVAAKLTTLTVTGNNVGLNALNLTATAAKATNVVLDSSNHVSVTATKAGDMVTAGNIKVAAGDNLTVTGVATGTVTDAYVALQADTANTLTVEGAADANLTVAQGNLAAAKIDVISTSGAGAITITGATSADFAAAVARATAGTGGIKLEASDADFALTKTQLDGVVSVKGGLTDRDVTLNSATNADLAADVAKITKQGTGGIVVVGANTQAFTITKTQLDGLKALEATGSNDITMTGATGAAFTADLAKLTATSDDIIFTGASNQSFSVTSAQLTKMGAGDATTVLTATGSGNITLTTTGHDTGDLSGETGLLAFATGTLSVTFDAATVAGNQDSVYDLSALNATVSSVDASTIAGNSTFGVTTGTGAQTIKAAASDGNYTGGAGADVYILTGAAAGTVVIGDTDSGNTVATADSITGYVGSSFKLKLGANAVAASESSSTYSGNTLVAGTAVADFAAALTAANTAFAATNAGTGASVTALTALEYFVVKDAANTYVFIDNDGNGTAAEQVIVLTGAPTVTISDIIA